ncbi:MAG: M24 family metallopeptidase [Candidatus Dormibacteraceae bacterium]
MATEVGDRLYPRFTAGEFERRHRAVREAMAGAEVSALVVFGNRGSHHEVQYLSNFPVTFEAVLVFPLEGEPALLVRYPNHVANARRVGVVADVRRLDDGAASTVVATLAEKGLGGRIGLAGPVSYQRHAALIRELAGTAPVDFGPRLTGMRRVKSVEEMGFIRRGAELSDLAIAALEREARPGMTEHDLALIVESAYLPLGGTTHIHFIGATSMADPDLCAPAQTQSGRRLRAGDVILTEISAQFHGHWGQVLRTFSVAAGPTPSYRRMHEVAVEAFERITGLIRPGASSEAVLDAAELIHEAGFTIYDDLVHCAVGGVYAPYLRTRRTALGPAAPFTFEVGMVIVVQPNVITPDERMGVQFGEMLQVTPTGVESLHHSPRGFLRCG